MLNKGLLLYGKMAKCIYSKKTSLRVLRGRDKTLIPSGGGGGDVLDKFN